MQVHKALVEHKWTSAVRRSIVRERVWSGINAEVIGVVSFFLGFIVNRGVVTDRRACTSCVWIAKILAC